METFEVIILGAGASGLMCAANIKDKKTLILEGNKKPGLKLLASGGGLCNFYNADLTFKNYHSQNPHFCISALSSYTLQDFKGLLKRNKVDFTLRPDGKYFANSSKEVLSALLSEITENTHFRFGEKFESAAKKDGFFEITANGKTYKSKILVCAMGGLSFPALGATSAALNLAESFGHSIIPPYPALCGLIFKEPLKTRFADTSGISLQAEVSYSKNSFSGGLLFTHEGLSGPALFQLSLYGIKDKTIKINFAPEINAAEYILAHKNGPKNISSVLQGLLPPRLVKALLNGFDKKSADLNKKEIQNLANSINSFTIENPKLTGYAKAEVTAGGINTKEISSKTMMSLKEENLYFIGECLDITGQLGGYNLAWAWASAAAAAKDINLK